MLLLYALKTVYYTKDMKREQRYTYLFCTHILFHIHGYTINCYLVQPFCSISYKRIVTMYSIWRNLCNNKAHAYDILALTDLILLLVCKFMLMTCCIFINQGPIPQQIMLVSSYFSSWAVERGKKRSLLFYFVNVSFPVCQLTGVL